VRVLFQEFYSFSQVVVNDSGNKYVCHQVDFKYFLNSDSAKLITQCLESGLD